MDNKKYPIGQFKYPKDLTHDLLSEWITTIATFSKNLNMQVQNLTDKQLDSSYRKNGWTLRQIVHHCADSHMNAFCRMKLALTEDEPTIKPYFEDRWAQLKDYELSLDASLAILEGLHTRWEILLKSISNSDLNRKFVHPEGNRRISIVEAIGMYAWHCEHHLAHIMLSKKLGND